jgi:hypothetical protein
VPEYYQRLIADEEPAFLESLIALRTGHGQGWLSRIAPLWEQKNTEPSAIAGWKLYVNGNVRELRLVVDHIFTPNATNSVKVFLSQEKNHIERGLQGGARAAEFRVEEFQRRGFDLSRNIDVRISTFRELVLGLATDRPIFFRYPVGRRTGWMPAIEEGQHVFATGIVILWPPSVEQGQRLQLGPSVIPPILLGRIKVPYNNPEQYLLAQTVELTALHEPQPLTWNDQTLLYIGPKPYLDVCEDDLNCPKQPDWLFVLGSEARVSLRNHPAQEPMPRWQCVDGSFDGGDVTVTVRPAELGKPVRISCGKARTELVFIPPQALDNKVPDWRWQPCRDAANVARFAPNGLDLGTLSSPNQLCLSLSRTLREIVWWWQIGIVGTPEGVNTCKDFDDHGALGPYQLCIWVPEGQTANILFNGEQVRTLRGPIFDSFLVRELLPHLDFARFQNDPKLDELVLHPGHGPEARLADIMRVPNRPALVWCGDVPGVFFPDGTTPAQYSVARFFETGLEHDRLQVISCADSSPGRSKSLDNLHERQGAEGVWLLLVRGQHVAASLRQFLFQNCPVEDEMTLHEPATTLQQRLGLAEGGGGNARQILELLAAYTSSLSATPVFRQAINERAVLDFGAVPQQAAFWDAFFRTNCRLDASCSPLEDTLGLMLKAGFNWCSEPQWFSKAYQSIVRMCNLARNVNFKDITKTEKENLLAACPVLYAARFIAEGFPCDLRPPKPIDQRNDGMAKFLAFLPAMGDGGRLRVRVPGVQVPPNRNLQLRGNEGVACHGFYHGGIQVHWQNKVQPLPAIGNEHVPLGVMVDGDWHSAVVTVGKDDAFAEYIVDRICGDKGKIDPCDLTDVFQSALDLGHELIGPREDRRLAHMLSLISDKLGGWAQEDSEQCNRQVIYQAAVVSRLHAWLGKEEDFPDSWPLRDNSCYQGVCHILSQIWEIPARRAMLMRDLIQTEWFITWFRC